jgi:hypothetical protein
MSSVIKDMRMQLKSMEIKNILANYGVYPFEENDNEVIFPTACHNLEGGSPKLYYYKKEKIFKCYTECNSMFDIFELVIKINKLRGNEINLYQAIKETGVEEEEVSKEIYDDLEYLRKMTKNRYSNENNINQINILNKNILDRFLYKQEGVKSWLDEGITEKTMRKFDIGYDSFLNAIAIPNFDNEGDLVGIRGRFLNPDSPHKYLPLKSYGETFSFPTGRYLYGLNQNKDNIKKKGIVIIFEGEKSVLKAESILSDNISVATFSNKISIDQLNLLLSLGINEAILAFDKDYKTKKEREEQIKKWDKIVSILKPFFNISFLVDTTNLLGYKNSPIDKGEDTFMDLIKYRLKR